MLERNAPKQVSDGARDRIALYLRVRRPTCEDGGERLRGVKRALQPSRLQGGGEQLENAILKQETEDRGWGVV